MAWARSLSEFQTSFLDEKSCAAFLFERRWPQGFVCPTCGGPRAALLKSRAHTYECLDCGRQTSITAGTVMHRSKLPLTVLGRASHSNPLEWYVGSPTRGPTRHHVQDCLVVGAEAATLDDRSPALAAGGGGGGRPDQNSIPRQQQLFDPVKSAEILIARAVEVIDRGTNQAKPKRKTGEVPGHSVWAYPSRRHPRQLRGFDRGFCAGQREDPNDAAHHGHQSYPGLTDYRHDPRAVGKMAGHIVLPWVHRVFALMKRWGLGTYHRLRRKHIDSYLNEFVFRYNRRFYRHVSCETLLRLASHHHPSSYRDIVGRDNPRKGVLTVRREAWRRRTATGMRADRSRPPERIEPNPVSDLIRQP